MVYGPPATITTLRLESTATATSDSVVRVVSPIRDNGIERSSAAQIDGISASMLCSDGVHPVTGDAAPGAPRRRHPPVRGQLRSGSRESDLPPRPAGLSL